MNRQDAGVLMILFLSATLYMTAPPPKQIKAKNIEQESKSTAQHMTAKQSKSIKHHKA